MNTERKLNSLKSYEITPEQMYNIIKNNEQGGISGYYCNKKYFDYRQSIWVKKREKILNSKKVIWPPENWISDKETGKKIPPKKRGFLDEQFKWIRSFSDPKKSEEIKNMLEEKGKKIPEIKFKSDFDKKVNAKDLGNAVKEREKELVKIREQIKAVPEYKQNAIAQAIEKIKKNEHKPKVGKSNWSKNMRVMSNADNEYLGEQYPFWNPNPKESDKQKAEFNPNKIRILKRNPSWSIGPRDNSLNRSRESASQYIKARDEKLEEKANSVLQKLGVDRNKYFIDPIKSFDSVNNHGKLPIIFRKVFNFADTEQYKSAKEKRNNETPAPNSYWDDGQSKVKLRNNIDDDQAKKYIMPRERSYKRLYLAESKKSVY